MPTYLLTDLSTDLTGGDDFDQQLWFGFGRPSPNTITISVPALSTETSYGYTEPEYPNNSNWESGVITVEVFVTTAAAGMFLDVESSRITATGTVQETTGKAGEQAMSTTGLLNFTIPSQNWNAGTDTDRLRINYIFRNGNSHGSTNVKIQVNTDDCEVVTLIEHGGLIAGGDLVVVFHSKGLVANTCQKIWNTLERLKYYVSKITSDLLGGDDFNATLFKFPEDTNKYSITVPNATTDTSYAFTKAGSPFNDDWETGNFIIKVERVE